MLRYKAKREFYEDLFILVCSLYIYIYGNTTSTIILFIIKFEDCRFFQTIFYLHVVFF